MYVDYRLIQCFVHFSLIRQIFHSFESTVLPKVFQLLAGYRYVRAVFPFLTDKVAPTANRNCI